MWWGNAGQELDKTSKKLIYMFDIYGGIGLDVREFISVHYPSGIFNSRVHVGCRGRDTVGIYPAMTSTLLSLPQKLESMYFCGTADYYISSNGFTGNKRRLAELFSIHNMVLDVDSHDFTLNFDFKLECFLKRLHHSVFGVVIPNPSSIVETGRGVQFWWALEPVAACYKPAFDDLIDYYIKVVSDVLSEDSLTEDFSCFSVDEGASRNISGYFRLPDTMNTVACKKVVYTTNKERYKLMDLIIQMKEIEKEFIDSKKQLEKKTSSQLVYTNQIKTPREYIELLDARMNAFDMLRKLRGRTIGNEERNNLCFMVYNTLIPVYGHDISMEKLKVFNSGFQSPMTSRELNVVICTAKSKGGYSYSTEKICAFLGINDEEALAIGLVSTSCSNAQQKKAAMLIKKKTRDDKILELYDSGKTLELISLEAKVSIPTIMKILNVNDRSRKNERKENILRLAEQGKKHSEIAVLCNCSIKTVSRALKQSQQKENVTVSKNELESPYKPHCVANDQR